MGPQQYIDSYYSNYFKREDFHKAFDYFDGLAYINLDHRPDRQKSLEENFAEHNIIGTRLPAYKLSVDTLTNLRAEAPTWAPAARGCSAGHAKIIREAKRLDLRNIIIFEDDARFYPNVRDTIMPIIEDLKRIEWDLLYFGCDISLYWFNDEHGVPGLGPLRDDSNLTLPVVLTDNLWHASHGGWGAFAYAVNNTFYDYFLMEEDDREEHLRVLYFAPDAFLKHACHSNRFLLSNEPIAYPIDDFTDVGEHQCNRELFKLQSNWYKKLNSTR
jgi:GR25 family glycosyltransferase involved in LPS biosynthesis